MRLKRTSGNSTFLFLMPRSHKKVICWSKNMPQDYLFFSSSFLVVQCPSFPWLSLM
uniref:Uncharacterized protein n=1 Tax=Arundo donax TaxID=35708 RepID=A0A0A9HI14_ARUDO